MSNVELLVHQAKTRFQARDYEACMSLTDEVLRADPDNAEASWLLKEAQRQWEDQRSLEQLEIYVENLKKEAIDLFDKEQYEQCLGMFRFLSELEPDNRMLREYVKLSQQMFVESIGPEPLPLTREAVALPDSGGRRPITSHPDSEPSKREEADLLPAAVEPTAEGQAPKAALPVRSFKAAKPTSGAGVAEVVSPSTRQQIIQEYLAANRLAREKPSWNLRLVPATLVLLTVLAAGYFWLHSTANVTGIEIQTVPDGASVFIDDKEAGETPFRQQGIAAGNHVVRLERRGYKAYTRPLAIEEARTLVLDVLLERARPGSPPPVQSVAPVPKLTQPQTPPPAVPASDSVQTDWPDARIAQSVIHHHLLGSCTGRLKIEGDRISFWSPGNARDGFTRPVKQISSVQLDEKLVIEFKDKTYRFEALARDSANSRRLAPFYDQIKRQKAAPPNSPRGGQ